MSNIKSAEKRYRQDKKRNLQNKATKSVMRTEFRKLREAVQAKEKEQALALLPVVFKKIDKAAKAGCIHRNTAARRKALASSLVNSLR